MRLLWNDPLLHSPRSREQICARVSAVCWREHTPWGGRGKRQFLSFLAYTFLWNAHPGLDISVQLDGDGGEDQGWVVEANPEPIRERQSGNPEGFSNPGEPRRIPIRKKTQSGARKSQSGPGLNHANGYDHDCCGQFGDCGLVATTTATATTTIAAAQRRRRLRRWRW